MASRVGLYLLPLASLWHLVVVFIYGMSRLLSSVVCGISRASLGGFYLWILWWFVCVVLGAASRCGSYLWHLVVVVICRLWHSIAYLGGFYLWHLVVVCMGISWLFLFLDLGISMTSCGVFFSLSMASCGGFD